jgi:hypothetical protein
VKNVKPAVDGSADPGVSWCGEHFKSWFEEQMTYNIGSLASMIFEVPQSIKNK